ncbi:MAG: aminoacyltransferase, partial [Anaerolineae bacterium]|nr:aminoacyltransferase [Anaerolineae bacterium]
MDKAAWNQVIAQLPAPQLLQTWEWGQVKAKFGWTPYYKLWRGEDDSITAAALVLERTIDLPGMAPRLRMHYTPKGPLLADWADGALRKQVL